MVHASHWQVEVLRVCVAPQERLHSQAHALELRVKPPVHVRVQVGCCCWAWQVHVEVSRLCPVGQERLHSQAQVPELRVKPPVHVRLQDGCWAWQVHVPAVRTCPAGQVLVHTQEQVVVRSVYPGPQERHEHAQVLGSWMKPVAQGLLHRHVQVAVSRLWPVGQVLRHVAGGGGGVDEGFLLQAIAACSL